MKVSDVDNDVEIELGYSFPTALSLTHYNLCSLLYYS